MCRTLVDSGCLRSRDENKLASASKCNPKHFFMLCPLEGYLIYSRGQYIMFCSLEENPKRHFIPFCPQEGLAVGHFITFWPLEECPLFHSIRWKGTSWCFDRWKCTLDGTLSGFVHWLGTFEDFFIEFYTLEKQPRGTKSCFVHLKGTPEGTMSHFAHWKGIVAGTLSCCIYHRTSKRALSQHCNHPLPSPPRIGKFWGELGCSEVCIAALYGGDSVVGALVLL